MKRPEESRRALNAIEKEASRLSILVDNLLNHAGGLRDKSAPGEVDHDADVNRDIQSSVVRDIVTPPGGNVWVESASAGGARFVAELRIAPAMAPP